MKSNRILVPLDGSAQSNAALPLARTLAKVTNASITLMRVVPLDDLAEGHTARSALHRIAEELTASGLTVSSIVREGRAADEILEQIRTGPPSVVVMRTHARAGVERLILGSVTEHVLKESAVPIVLMRPGQRRLTRIEKLLVPVDGSPGGAIALGTAVALARASGAAIKLLEVVVPIPLQSLAAYPYGGLAYYDPVWDDETQTSAQTYVDGLAGRLRDGGFTIEAQVKVAAAVPNAIVEAADQDDVDMVVMSTHALTGPARALLGSTADAVVRNAPCPVMLIHRVESSITEDIALPASEAATV